MSGNAPRKFTLCKEERLKSRKLIERVFREGKSFALFPFRVYFAPLPALPRGSRGMIGAGGEVGSGDRAVTGEKVGAGEKVFLQAGFGAGARNFKKAVDRNRIKRLTREAYRLQKHGLQDHLTNKGKALAVFFIYVGKELPDQALVSAKIGLILQKLVLETGT